MATNNRCAECGARFIDGHLKNCRQARKTGGQVLDKPTANQITYAKDLLVKLGYDTDSYDFTTMSFRRCSELIDELKQEWEGQ